MTQRTKILMGTFITISVNKKYKHHITPAFAIVKDVEKSLSSFDETALLYQLNKNKTIALDNNLYEALTLSARYYEQTQHYFNIAIGKITKDLYRFGEEQRIPKKEQLQQSNISLKNLIFNKNSASLRDNIKLDLGGMGKGFAVSKVADYFKDKNITDVKIAASGDIQCLGFCKIEIRNPFSNSPLAIFRTKKQNMSISTSGNYNRYVKETKNNHLINPKTKLSANEFISITLISELSSSDIDAFTTAVSVMPKEKALKFLKSLDVGYILLDIKNNLLISTNINKYVKELYSNF